MLETIVCLERKHIDREVRIVFDLLREHKATLTNIDGFAWAWVVPGQLPNATIASLRKIDASFDTRKQPAR